MKPSSPRENVWLGRYAVFVAACTLVLIFAGGLVTSTESGLAVPDWPLSYGMLMPPMVGGILYEHGHRMVAGAVALLTAILCLWTWRRESRPWVRRLAFIAVAAVLLQALLGGLTVLLMLPTVVSVSHAGLAQIFFCLTVALAVATSRGWKQSPARQPVGDAFPLPVLAATTTAIIYIQIILGAVMRHTGAGLAIPDFPLMYGSLLQPPLVGGIRIHFAHRVGALVVSIAILLVLIQALRTHRDDPWLVRPAILLGFLLVAQITLGAMTIWSIKAVIPTTLHVATGAATLATSLVLTLRAMRRFRLADAPEASPVMAREVIA